MRELKDVLADLPEIAAAVSPVGLVANSSG